MHTGEHIARNTPKHIFRVYPSHNHYCLYFDVRADSLVHLKKYISAEQQLPDSPYKHAHVRTELDNMSEVVDEEPVEHLKKKNMNFMNVHQVRRKCTWCPQEDAGLFAFERGCW